MSQFDNIIPIDNLTEGVLDLLSDDDYLLADMPFFPVTTTNKAKLVGRDYSKVSKSILPKNVGKEFFEYLRAKESLSKISTLAAKFKDSRNNRNQLNKRFAYMADKFITGVGTDGLGGGSTTDRDEKDFIEDVRSEARAKRSSCPIDDEEQRLVLRNSIASTSGWLNINLGGIPFGSPIQVAKFVVKLFALENPTTGTSVDDKQLNKIISEDPRYSFLKYIFCYNHPGNPDNGEFITLVNNFERGSFQRLMYQKGSNQYRSKGR